MELGRLPSFPPPQCTGLEPEPLFPGLRWRGAGGEAAGGWGEGGDEERREGEKGRGKKEGESYAAVL